MCRVCARVPRPTYAQLYNEIFTAIDPDVVVTRRLLEACCLRTRLAVARHLDKGMRTQHVFQKLSPRSRLKISLHGRQAEACCATRLNALQIRIAKHLWRPRGALPSRDAARIMAVLSRSD